MEFDIILCSFLSRLQQLQQPQAIALVTPMSVTGMSHQRADSSTVNQSSDSRQTEFASCLSRTRSCSRMKPAMSITETSTAQTPVNRAVGTGRIASIDAFRGLTVIVTVFVDNLDFVKGLPKWTYHMPVGSNGISTWIWSFPLFYSRWECRSPYPWTAERPQETLMAGYGSTTWSVL